MAEYPEELIESMIALVRKLTTNPHMTNDCKTARAIAAELPAPVDPDAEHACLLVKEMMADGFMFANSVQACDVALAAIKRGRTLAADAQSEWGFKPATQGDR